jgi:hypothetical protein
MSDERNMFAYRLVTCLCLGVCGLAPGVMGQTYITFRVNGAQYTYPQSINRSGAITGFGLASERRSNVLRVCRR